VGDFLPQGDVHGDFLAGASHGQHVRITVLGEANDRLDGAADGTDVGTVT